MLNLVLPVLISFASLVSSQCQPSNATFLFPPTTAPGLTAQLVFSNLSTPRGITFDALNTLLVVERGVGVSSFVGRNDSSCNGFQREPVLDNPGLTHGIEIDGEELYVSTQLQVLLYRYDAHTRSVSPGAPKVIVDGLPSDGDLTTRTLLLVPSLQGAPRSLLVSDGPLTNIDFTAQDPANGRSQVRSYALGPAGAFAPLVPAGGWVWPSNASNSTSKNQKEGRLLASGIRNAAGLSLAPNPDIHPDALWVVENGASLNDIIGDALSTDDPADELELVSLGSASSARRFFGFPFCHTGFAPLPAPFDVVNPGDQFSINTTTGVTNTVCRDPEFNVPPTLLFQPHSVPLDIKFYRRTGSPKLFLSGPGLPIAWTGDAFSSFHGSFDRVPPTGYGVVRIPWKSDGSGPLASPRTKMGYDFILHVPDLTVCPGACVRPVGLAFDALGRLFVSSDSTGEVFYIQKTFYARIL